MVGSVQCPNCQAQNAADAEVCDNCGTILILASIDRTLPVLPTESTADGDETVITLGGRPGRLRPSVAQVSGYCTQVGRVRKVNQDSLLVMSVDRVTNSIAQPLGLYAVADGMGGHTAGEVASGALVGALAGEAQAGLFRRGLESALAENDVVSWINSAVAAANRAVYQKRVTEGSNMGSTLVMVVLDHTTAHLAHVGDSRAYRLPAEGDLERLTVDHSLVEQLVRAKSITPAEAVNHPKRSVIYRTMGEKEEVDIELQTIELEPGDRLILCSDGLNSMVEDEVIAEVARSKAAPADAARALARAANEAGGKDNITVIVVDIVSLEPGPV